MKRLSMLWAIILIASGLTALTSCSSNDEDTPVQDEWESLGLMLTREQDKQDTMTVIDYFERNGIKFHLIDITERFVKALYYDDQFVPVTHVNLEALPDPIQTIARSWGQSGSVTKVFRLEYEGEAYYEIRNLLMSSISDFYDSKGERCNIPDYKSVTEGACCILVLDTEIVKSAEGAPNYLIGIWQKTYDTFANPIITNKNILVLVNFQSILGWRMNNNSFKSKHK